jgi:hypothetical protein
MSSPIFAPLAKTHQTDIERRVRRPAFEYRPRPHRGLDVRRAIVAMRTSASPASRRRPTNPSPRSAK